MQSVLGMILFALAVMIALASIPFAMMMAAFSIDSGKSKSGQMVFVFSVCVLAGLIPAYFLGCWGWRMIW